MRAKNREPLTKPMNPSAGSPPGLHELFLLRVLGPSRRAVSTETFGRGALHEHTDVSASPWLPSGPSSWPPGTRGNFFGKTTKYEEKTLCSHTPHRKSQTPNNSQLFLFVSNSDDLHPSSDGLQPASHGLHPSSDGLQPTSDASMASNISNLLAMASNLLAMASTY